MATTSPPSATAPAEAKHWRRFKLLLAGVVLLVGANIYVWIDAAKEPAPVRPAQKVVVQPPTAPSFEGPSQKLKQTVIVPTLESSVPEGKSAIWVGTLPMAWQALEKVAGPMELPQAKQLAAQLRATPSPELAAQSYYVAAGFHKDGILERIRRELPVRFPMAPRPEDASPMGVAMVYAYLEAAIGFEHEFRINDDPLRFKAAAGTVTPVYAFGVPEKDSGKGDTTYRGQVEVLFHDDEGFAVDLSCRTKPYQIVLARLPRAATLAAALAQVKKRTGQRRGLASDAVLLVPFMHWQVDHRFRELEKQVIVNKSHPPDSFIGQAMQSIRFKLDTKGVEVTARTRLESDWSQGPEHLIFDRPFLIVLRKRGTSAPFFVMWVDNAELLQRP